VEDNKKSQYIVLGDPLRLSQAITILATNAVEASFSNESEVSIEISSVGRSVLISVKNFGRGIPSSKREQLFKPQKSTKETGLGIGLYVTKQIIETHFKGKLWLSPATEYTQFNIEIPKIKR
jgi:signal transduction histidine kinase